MASDPGDSVLRQQLLALLPECSRGEGCDAGCPLRGIRQAPSYEQAARLLTEHQVRDLLQAHNLCPRTREAGKARGSE